MIKISVIVPVFKVEKYLEKCINSLINQTLKDIEIILVNDGSPDTCPKICAAYAEKDDRIKVINKMNEGVSAARNDGLQISTGEYIIFCDSDDWLLETGLEELYRKALQSGSDIVIGDVYLAKEKENKYVKFYKNSFDTEDKQFILKLIQADIYRTYCPLPDETGPAFGYGGPWNKLVKKELLINNNISFDLRLKGIFDDILYTAYILSYAQKVSYIQKPVYYYRIIEGSITHSFKPNAIEINSAIFNCWQEFFSKQKNSDFYQKPFYACVLRRLEETINIYFKNKKNTKKRKYLKKELRNLIKTEPYKSALRYVDLSKISKKQKLLVYLGRIKLIDLIYILPLFGK